MRDEAKGPGDSRFFCAARRRNAMVSGRELVSLKLPGWGRVAASPDEVVPYVVMDEAGDRVEPISVFLRDFIACGNRRSSARSYCYALLRWWRFLLAVDVPWDRAGPAEGRDYVLWLGQADKPVAGRRTRSAATAGRVNQVTRKPYPGDKYQPRTIRNGNAVVRSFYEF
jgi:integrase/recombinase XerD